jgi:protein-L-isoaspartate(D-aspartate) O-methyltransferase
VPPALREQLAPGGRLILPLRAPRGDEQRLVLVERGKRGFFQSDLDAVRFVPMQAGKA